MNECKICGNEFKTFYAASYPGRMDSSKPNMAYEIERFLNRQIKLGWQVIGQSGSDTVVHIILGRMRDAKYALTDPALDENAPEQPSNPE